jgi:DNA adenine methylase
MLESEELATTTTNRHQMTSTIPKKEIFKSQLLKWVGNKQSQAYDIISYFPENYGNYYEPFLGSGGVLGVLAPKKAIASDVFLPLVEIWQMLSKNPNGLKEAYLVRHNLISAMGKKEAYQKILDSYNTKPNGEDLLFLCRTCYGGVVRFRKKDGFMSTPVGAHSAMPPANFNDRVDKWSIRTAGVDFIHMDFAVAMRSAKPGDLVYCDPPYVDSQTILYGAQDFSLKRLFEEILDAKKRGVYIALSIDGTKFSGAKLCNVDIPDGLFEKEVYISVGRSMLRRFQIEGEDASENFVKDRLLLTY